MKISKMPLLAVVFGSALLFASCGSDTKTADRPLSAEEMGSEEFDAPVVKGDTIFITLEGDDDMRFNQKELRVKAGQIVDLTLKHTGQMPEKAMGHNFVLLAEGTDVTQFGQKAASAAETDYIPESEKERILAHTDLIGGGETTTVRFEAPPKGRYTYLCSFPGHYVIMQGVLYVE